MNELAVVEKQGLIAALHSGKLDAAVPFRREIFLYHTHIAGSVYCDEIEEIADEIKENDILKLKREPNNEHDSLAIMILDPKGRKMGYVPRKDNPVLARLLDAGKDLYGIFKFKHYENTEELEKDALDSVETRYENGARFIERVRYFDFRIDIYMRD